MQISGCSGTARRRSITIQDIATHGRSGIVVFSGDGFSPNMVAFLLSTGKAVELSELEYGSLLLVPELA